MNTLHIRRATPADHAVIVEFNSALALETEGKALIPEVISAGVAAILANENRGFYIIAERAGERIGTLMITTEWSDWRNGMFWWVESVYVPPQARGQGVYRAMYDHVRNVAAHDPGVCGFRLYVERDNVRAQKTYESLGMSKTHYNIYEELKSGIVFCHDVAKG
jgi:ribosomal protein S18 acetylase RimI-like enzyme